MAGKAAEGARELEFWREELAGLKPLELPTDRPRPPVGSASVGSVLLTVEAGTADQVRAVARGEGVTLFVALSSVFQMLLGRYSGQDDLAVGTSGSGLGRSEAVGPGGADDTLVLRADLSGDPTVRELFRRVRERVWNACAHRPLPIDRLVADLDQVRDPSRAPLCQAWFALPDGADDTTFHGSGAVPRRPPGAGFDLAMSVRERGTELQIRLEYSSDLFDRATAERIAGHYRNLLGVMADPEVPLSRMEMLSEAERRQILVEWNDTAVDYPRDLQVHELVERQAGTSPDAVAVVFEDLRLTYQQLNEQANQLAHHLRGLGVGPDVLAGICVERGPAMIVGLLGILKAGGAYVPLDPAYPAERLAFMLKDSATPVVITQAPLVDRLPAAAARTLVCLDTDRDVIAACPSTAPTPITGPGDLAYVIYTSGSTGSPKGVQIEHHSLVGRAWEMRQRYGLTANDRVLQFASISFDSSVEQIFPALTAGAAVVLRGEHFDAEAVMTSIRRHGVTLMQAPPSVWSQLLQDPRALQLVQSAVRHVVLAGEAVPPGFLERWFAQGRAPLHNAYGPTETTVTATNALIRAATPRAPIGRPVANTVVFVMDRFGRPAPVGVTGELWIGGAGVARGYLNRPELTAERFVPHPFSADPAARVYRTGDVVRWLPDGNLEFLGRVDDQVKVRGFRIELGEIEAALGAHQSVGAGVVVASEEPSGDKRLVAYVVAAGSEVPTTARLQSFLRDRLPDHMVPSAFVALQRLPLTPNGKVDRKKLSTLEGQRLDLGDQYVAPRNELEAVTAGIWTRVLGVERVGIHDDFFRLGGDSIVAIQLLGRLRKRFGVQLPVQELLNRPTVERFCSFLGGQLAEQPSPAGAERGPVDPVSGDGPLLPIQDWFFRSNFARPEHWNQAFLIATPRLDVDQLRACVRELGTRHGAFRLRYRRNSAGEVVQYCQEEFEPTDLVVGTAASIEDHQAQLTAWQADFDLERGPVYRIGYLEGLADGSARVFVACHHLIVDAVSWRVLAEDLESLYSAQSPQQVGSTQ